jgi:hypothetical protein
VHGLGDAFVPLPEIGEELRGRVVRGFRIPKSADVGEADEIPRIDQKGSTGLVFIPDGFGKAGQPAGLFGITPASDDMAADFLGEEDHDAFPGQGAPEREGDSDAEKEDDAKDEEDRPTA